MCVVGYGTVVRVGSDSHTTTTQGTFKVGSRVMGMMPVTTFAVLEQSSSSSSTMSTVQSLPSLPGISPSRCLDVLGISGLSAYMGIFVASTRPPTKGDTVVVSAAAGGVGTLAVQMAKRTGARVVGIAGGPDKVDFLLNQVGVDAVVDYKDTTMTLEEQLTLACPNGIDFFFDNVGGSTLDAVLTHINVGARIVICRAISQYDTGTLYSDPRGPTNYLKLAERKCHHVRLCSWALPFESTNHVGGHELYPMELLARNSQVLCPSRERH
jgi:NADPH-dependent curcumin reductase